MIFLKLSKFRVFFRKKPRLRPCLLVAKVTLEESFLLRSVDKALEEDNVDTADPDALTSTVVLAPGLAACAWRDLIVFKEIKVTLR